MKVGIITFHFVSNQGGVLQAYASQAFLQKHGHEACIINYRPKYHTVRYAAHKNPFRYAGWYWKRFGNKGLISRILLTFRSFIRCIVLNLKKTDRKKSQLFEAFISRNLKQTTRYTSLKQLQKNPPLLDAYVSGSDQLWNPDLLNFAFDPAYFLDFGASSVRKVAYAVSSGKKLSAKEESQLAALCKNFTAISLREYEESTVMAIGREVSICLDPTLLLEAKDYHEIESSVVEKEPYIFVYGFESNDDIQQAVDKAVAKYNCKIINGSPDRIFLSNPCMKIKDYAPDRFLSFIKNAQCVVTNSFHGSAFSIIYKKDFITVTHTTRGKRMSSLLDNLGLSGRLFGRPEFDFDRPVDWNSVTAKLSELKEKSSVFLLNSISK